jgi:hypothetical protein
LGSLGILGILGIENRKLKIEKILSFSKPATTTKKKFQKIYKKKNYFIFIFFRPRGRTRAFARTHGRIRADASCFIPGNFKKDATVRLSHGRPRGHRPIVRPSV